MLAPVFQSFELYLALSVFVFLQHDHYTPASTTTATHHYHTTAQIRLHPYSGVGADVGLDVGADVGADVGGDGEGGGKLHFHS